MHPSGRRHRLPTLRAGPHRLAVSTGRPGGGI
jgi:hypothetical protein